MNHSCVVKLCTCTCLTNGLQTITSLAHIPHIGLQWKWPIDPFLEGSWNTCSLIIKVENSEPIPSFKVPGMKYAFQDHQSRKFRTKPWFCLICRKTLKLLGTSVSEDKKPVNKKSRIRTHPSKVQGKGEHK